MTASAARLLLVECDDVRALFFEQAAAFVGVDIDQPEVDMTTCARR